MVGNDGCAVRKKPLLLLRLKVRAPQRTLPYLARHTQHAHGPMANAGFTPAATNNYHDWE